MKVLLLASLSILHGLAQAGEPVPKGNLEAMQGRWRLDTKQSVLFSVPKAVKEELPGDLGKALADIRFDGNRLYIGISKESVSVATDVQIEGLRASAEGFQLLCVTFPSGRAILGSYKVDTENLEVRFPHTCVCSRSGIIVRFTHSGK